MLVLALQFSRAAWDRFSPKSPESWRSRERSRSSPAGALGPCRRQVRARFPEGGSLPQNGTV